MDSLQKQLGDKQGNPEDIDKLQKDLQKLKEAAKGLADNNSAAAQAARNQMAQSASELARKAESLGMSLPSLEEAVTALQNAQVEQFLKDLNLAQQDLEKLAEMAKAMAQLQQQAEKLGKDLAEQLKNGQAQAAIESLQKMMDQLNAPNLSPAEMAKLAEQIASSIKPGEPYGEVSDHLKKAALASKAGDKPKSAAALAEAQKELKSLLDKMGDAQALMSSLSDLQRAQMAVGNCVGWAQCNSPFASKKSGQGKGGKGVGTWANSSAWSMPDHIDDLWDNTGVERPDQAGKGHTDRDASRPDGLVPTKVKGQMQSGAPMPSITLKGVSIKGDSKVAYTEAVTAAQIDAQAALSQDQVPKAYRNSVRDYFDEIKK
jgi:DNA-binding ferritin-like protein